MHTLKETNIEAGPLPTHRHQWSDSLMSGKQIGGLLTWSLVASSSFAFLLPYFLYGHLLIDFAIYGSLALVPLCLAAYFRAYPGVLVTWVAITFGIACSLWVHVGPHWSTGVITIFTFGNATGLIVGLAVAQFFHMHRQIVTTRLAALAQEQEAAQQQQAYAMQQQLNDLKDQLILNLSHELRTPLSIVYGYLELLANYPHQFDETQRADLVAHARNGCEELQELVNTMLDVNHLSLQELKAPVESIALASFIQEMIDQWDQQTMNDHPLCMNIPADITILAAPQYLRQILRNLLSNAFKYSPPHSRVFICATLEDPHPQGVASFPHVCVSVKDEGPGIPPADIPLLFHKFTRLKRDLTGTVSGLGLGLYLSKQLVEAMQGRIWVESSGKAGEGSRFCFFLPSASPCP